MLRLNGTDQTPERVQDVRYLETVRDPCPLSYNEQAALNFSLQRLHMVGADIRRAFKRKKNRRRAGEALTKVEAALRAAYIEIRNLEEAVDLPDHWDD